ncbi:hypothetical protein P7H75_05680 [Vagococcus carniphilus]|uniref:hypothetical protein n=1 Tax=Vagococcus carniphilus TaxID=218144 RepID=UPI002891B965|nr:hypothetical protein [Vagococcus carniphilus]MDT2814329.1 hypothetical protein [Vagococcus carniphilus]
MTEIAEITQKDREKIQEFVKKNKFVTYTMLADRFNISKSGMSLIMSGKDTSAKANGIIDAIVTMYEL